jgi:hypothetical protein
MAAQDSIHEVYLFADPKAPAINVGVLRAALEGRHDNEHVVIATGDGRTPYLPVRAVANSKDKAVLEV